MNTTSNLLRPLGIGDILDGAVKLYRDNFLLLMGIGACVYIPFCFLPLVIPQAAKFLIGTVSAAPAAVVIVTLLAVVIVAVLTGAVSAFLLPAVVTAAISERILNREISVIGSYRRVGKRLLSFIGAIVLMMLVGVIMVVIVVVFTILSDFLLSSRTLWNILGSVRGHGVGLPRVWIGRLTFLAFSALELGIGLFMLVIAVRLLFTLQAVVLEGSKATKALGRSWKLAKGNFWKILVILILVFIAMFLIRCLFGLVGGTVLAILGGGIDTAQNLMVYVMKFLQFPIVKGILDLFLQPFIMAVIVLLYYDMRVRKEAYDLEVMAKELAIEQV